MEDKDGRVRPEKQVGIGAVGLERRFGTDNDSEDDGWLGGKSDKKNKQP